MLGQEYGGMNEVLADIYTLTADEKYLLLDGEGTPIPDATTSQMPFPGINNVTFEAGVERWTRDISHGELIRDGYDETLTIDPNNRQFLYQGRDPAINTRYDQLPYRLGLRKLNRTVTD